MAPNTTPEQLRNPQLRPALWGLERGRVEEILSRAADRIEDLEAQLAQAVENSDAAESQDLKSEFDAVGNEVSAILQTAREAAEAMRERASVDAARWRSEAIGEAEERRRESSTDAEALRRDAWATGTALIEQAQAYARRIGEQADRDVLTVMGEAEREAHRLTSAARRDAEDMIRNATMTSEKLTAEAAKRRDEIIDAATRHASVAQERTHALEKRRDELLEELEHARSTLNLLEASMEERRDYVDSGSTVRVVPAPVADEGRQGWESGETVRVVKPEPKRHPGESTGRSKDVDMSQPPETVRVIPAEQMRRESTSVEPEPASEPEHVSDPEHVSEPEPDAPPEVAEPPAPRLPAEPLSAERESRQPEPQGDPAVDSLFASLKGRGRYQPDDPASGGPEAEIEHEPVAEREIEPETVITPDVDTGRDWIDERDIRLLPITNRALRGIKKSITELQNIALDKLRTDAAWRPDPKADADLLAADLITLWAEGFSAGHGVAEVMSDSKLKRPPTPHSDALDQFSGSLSAAVAEALDKAGDGQRERQSAASKIYRVWRSDEAEQRVRELAIKAYQLGVELSSSSES